jgi:hypothetical protein
MVAARDSRVPLPRSISANFVNRMPGSNQRNATAQTTVSNFASGSDQCPDLATSTREFGNGARFFCTIWAKFGPIEAATSSHPLLEIDAELSCVITDLEHTGAGAKVPGRLDDRHHLL